MTLEHWGWRLGSRASVTDSRLDLLVALGDTMEVQVFYGLGDGSFEDSVCFPYSSSGLSPRS